MLFCYMMATVRCVAAASSALRQVLAGPAQPAECLGATRGALYLNTAGHPGVLAVLAHDAVRLPCGLVLPATSAELAPGFMIVESYAPRHNARNSQGSWQIAVGDGAVRWTGPAGPVIVQAVREWAPARPVRGEVAAGALASVRSLLSRADPGIAELTRQSRRLADLALAARPGPARPVQACPVLANDEGAIFTTVARLLGNGPGLTPSGDDVLAGFLIGAAAFGLDAGPVRELVAALAPARTTALSAALLWHAARGECIDELAAVAAVLTGQSGPEQAGPAVSRLLGVGHTSGAALSVGLVISAEAALHARTRPQLAGTVLASTMLAGTVLASTVLPGTVLAASKRQVV